MSRPDESDDSLITGRHAVPYAPYVPKPWMQVRAGAGQLRVPAGPPVPPPLPHTPPPAPTAPPPPIVAVRSETMPSLDQLLTRTAATQAKVRAMTQAARAADQRIKKARRATQKGARGGAKARDRAIERVTLNERLAWRQLHDRELAQFLIAQRGRPFLPEDFREWFELRGHPPPHHPNVWGAMWMSAARQDLVVRTGVFRPMQARSSHHRVTAEWRKA